MHRLSTKNLRYAPTRLGLCTVEAEHVRMRYRTFVLFACLALAPTPPPATAQMLFAGLPIDGIPCQSSEGVRVHIHAQLQIFDHGKIVVVPAQIGIPPAGTCLYWLHTHAANGVIHIESPVVRTFTLGQFFDIWGMPLGTDRAAGLNAPHGRTLRYDVNGAAWKGDPRSIPLRDHEQIVIQLGPPYATPAKADWSRL